MEEAAEHFKDIPAIYDRMKSILDVGLGYLELGQSATTLSGGEAQARESGFRALSPTYAEDNLPTR